MFLLKNKIDKTVVTTIEKSIGKGVVNIGGIKRG